MEHSFGTPSTIEIKTVPRGTNSAVEKRARAFLVDFPTVVMFPTRFGTTRVISDTPTSMSDYLVFHVEHSTLRESSGLIDPDPQMNLGAQQFGNFSSAHRQ